MQSFSCVNHISSVQQPHCVTITIDSQQQYQTAPFLEHFHHSRKFYPTAILGIHTWEWNCQDLRQTFPDDITLFFKMVVLVYIPFNYYKRILLLMPLHPQQHLAWSSAAKASVTKYHQLGGINIRNLFSNSSGGWKPKIKLSAGIVPLEGCKERICSRLFCLACGWPFSPSLHIVFPLNVSGFRFPL